MIAQAGGSPRGRKFAAAHADTIVVHTKGIEAMRAYRDDVHKHMIACGRKPSDCKVLYLINPILGESIADAQERRKKRAAIALGRIDERLAHFGKVTNIDFGKFDLDKPLPDDVTTNGHQPESRAVPPDGERALDPGHDGELQCGRHVESSFAARPTPSPHRWAR